MAKRKRDDVKSALEPRRTTTFDAMVSRAPATWQPTTDFSELLQCLGRAQPAIQVPEGNVNEFETCTRDYEERFLWEPNAQLFERPCVNGTQCESVHMGGFVLREFLLPSELEDARASERPQRTCLMCARLDALRLHLQNNTRVAYGEPVLNVAYQDHGNLVGINGEYLEQDCLVPEGERAYTGLAAPIVVHSRSAYADHKRDGLRGWSQVGYARSTGNAVRDEEGSNHFLWRRGVLSGAKLDSPPKQ